MTGEDPPSIKDVVSMLFEDILSLSGRRNDLMQASTRRRDLHAVNIMPKYTHRALRAHHLRHNRFIRPRPLANQRRLANSGNTLSEVMDAISVTGGYTGVELFVKLELDVSKVFADSIDELVRKPFDLLNRVDFIKNLFPSNSTTSESNPLLSSSVSFSAGTHASVRGEMLLIMRHLISKHLIFILAHTNLYLINLVGFDITPAHVHNFLFSNQTLSSSFILNNTFIQFEDMSAKFALSAIISGSLNLSGVAALGLDDGTVELALGLGMDKVSNKIYFSELKSVITSLRDDASWQKLGVIDVALPIRFDFPHVGSGLGEVLNMIPKLPIILFINDDDLFNPDLPSIGVDLDLR